jgi:hypothetical protein
MHKTSALLSYRFTRVHAVNRDRADDSCGPSSDVLATTDYSLLQPPPPTQKQASNYGVIRGYGNCYSPHWAELRFGSGIGSGEERNPGLAK